MPANSTTIPTNERWASYAQVHELYRISRYTIWRLERDGLIQCARIGRSVRVDLHSLEAYLEEQASK